MPDALSAEIVKKQSREEIIKRIKESVGAAHANRQVIAVRKL